MKEKIFSAICSKLSLPQRSNVKNVPKKNLQHSPRKFYASVATSTTTTTQLTPLAKASKLVWRVKSRNSLPLSAATPFTQKPAASTNCLRTFALNSYASTGSKLPRLAALRAVKLRFSVRCRSLERGTSSNFALKSCANRCSWVEISSASNVKRKTTKP